MWTTQGVQVNYNDFHSITKPSSLQKESRPYKIHIDLVKAHSFLIAAEKPLESRVKGKLSDVDIVRALTALNLRWNRVPSNRTLMNPPPYGKHYRLALFVTADYPESVKVNTREVTNTIISLALMQRSYDFFPIIFTISKPLIQLAQYLNIGYYYGYDHNTFHMPLVNKMFEVAMRDVSADYYGIVNSDILLSDRIFLVLDQVDAMVEEGTVSPIRALAGVVHDAASVDLLTPATEPSGFTLTGYRGLIKKMVDRQYYYRHYCSADYFVFSRTTPLSVFGPYVLGRNNIDNYLLSRMDACNGTLVDTTFAIPAFHQGSETSIVKARRGIVLQGDYQYNINLMKQNSERKGCLIRNAQVGLYYQNASLQVFRWNKNQKVALA